MAQSERRAKAVLAAAVEYIKNRSEKEKSYATIQDLVTAVEKYEEATEALANLPEDPNAFFCPHCGAEKPPFGWNWNGGDTGPFAVAYLTCFCGKCKNIISVAVTQFIPQKQLAEQMMKQFQAVLAGKGGGILDA